MNLMHGDCLDLMAGIPTGSVDMILCDLPYGTTACKWDTVIPFEPLWAQYKRIAKPNAAIVLTAAQPFTTALISSNIGMFKYCWVWDKVSKTDVMNAKNKPLRQHEDVVVFSHGTTANCSPRRMNYNPQGLMAATRINAKNRNAAGYMGSARPSHQENYVCQNANYPSSILQISNANRTNVVHPTQKPVALMEYLIRTYTNEGDTVMDNCMGSGTTGVACANTGRNFIGIEKEAAYFEIAKQRIETAQLPLLEAA